MILALYHGPRTGIWKLVSWLVKTVTRGPYDHCEFILSDGSTVTSSLKTGGIAFVRKVYYSDQWHFVEVLGVDEAAVIQWFHDHDEDKFDILGMLGFLFWGALGRSNRWFCSEACAEASKLPESWRYSPNHLAAIFRWRLNQGA